MTVRERLQALSKKWREGPSYRVAFDCADELDAVIESMEEVLGSRSIDREAARALLETMRHAITGEYLGGGTPPPNSPTQKQILMDITNELAAVLGEQTPK